MDILQINKLKKVSKYINKNNKIIDDKKKVVFYYEKW